jgi:UDP-glucose 4-epimerase
MDSVLVTGVSRWLGLRLARRLTTAGVDRVIGVDLNEPADDVPGLEFVRADIQSPLVARLLAAEKVDAVVHTNISSRPGALGGRARMKENNVIGSLQLFAAIRHSPNVKRVVMRSSAAVYGSGPGDPSLLTEDHAGRHLDLAGYGKDCLEAETSARDCGRRRPDLNLVILRTQNVLGPTVDSSIARYLSLPVVPVALGYDPRLQLLHEDDAVDALWRALIADRRGIYNVAGDGVVFLSQALRRLRRPSLPLIQPAARAAAEVLRTMRVVDFPTDQLPVLLYGRVIDAGRAKRDLKWRPKYSTAECISDFADNRNPEPEPSSEEHLGWERELFEYLNRAMDRL